MFFAIITIYAHDITLWCHIAALPPLMLSATLISLRPLRHYATRHIIAIFAWYVRHCLRCYADNIIFAIFHYCYTYGCHDTYFRRRWLLPLPAYAIAFRLVIDSIAITGHCATDGLAAAITLTAASRHADISLIYAEATRRRFFLCQLHFITLMIRCRYYWCHCIFYWLLIFRRPGWWWPLRHYAGWLPLPPLFRLRRRRCRFRRCHADTPAERMGYYALAISCCHYAMLRHKMLCWSRWLRHYYYFRQR